ncbi:hypothetical protein T02_6954 [Trichinella nativa]|uniref:Uncharacterized protein n=1 Tax=Trichinella nativa TaxID=6335 RepID=A0A0V1KS44_9BILA|nr:hypothetical protein T06_14062 [Trichinella sp. T6]KRZ49879.1 hypothetical protein T02_6954 [Trichinella nativa]
MKTQRRRQKCLYDCHANEALLPELQRVVGHAKKTIARPRLGGAPLVSRGPSSVHVVLGVQYIFRMLGQRCKRT